MKRILCILLAAVFMLSLAWDGVIARSNPIGYHPIDRDSGEDHPWGGEENLVPDPTPIRSAVDESYTITGLVMLDNIVWRLVTTFWLQPIPSGETSVTIEGSTDYHTPNEGTTTGTSTNSGTEWSH